MALQCSNCGTNKTPLWRRGPDGRTTCNACGLYYRSKHQYRPTSLVRNSSQSDKTSDENIVPHLPHGNCPGGGLCNGTGGNPACDGCPAFNNRVLSNRQSRVALSSANGPENGASHESTILTDDKLIGASCHNCGTMTTPLWRRDQENNIICNACGLYQKLHGATRPVSMRKSIIKRRKRVSGPLPVQSFRYDGNTDPNGQPASPGSSDNSLLAFSRLVTQSIDYSQKQSVSSRTLQDNKDAASNTKSFFPQLNLDKLPPAEVLGDSVKLTERKTAIERPSKRQQNEILHSMDEPTNVQHDGSLLNDSHHHDITSQLKLSYHGLEDTHHLQMNSIGGSFSNSYNSLLSDKDFPADLLHDTATLESNTANMISTRDHDAVRQKLEQERMRLMNQILKIDDQLRATRYIHS